MELFEDENEVKASEGALVGQWYVNADSSTADFEREFQAKYKEFPGLASANAFDTLNIMADAVDQHL